jgi:hypothetical protein
MVENQNLLHIPEETKIKREKRTVLLAQQGLSEKSFQESIRKKMTEENLTFIAATYKTFDEFYDKEFKASGITLACKKGCSTCCHTLITSTEMEIDEAIKYVNHLPRDARIPIVKRVARMSREWRDYFNNNQFQIKVDPFKTFKDWEGKPCPFLGDSGACDIYPVRIVDCRTLTNLKPCNYPEKTTFFADIDTQGPSRYRFLSETWATNSIMENQQQKMGLAKATQSPVTPILHWLHIKRKEIG